jgi:CubicO group peptidase (beta-lactamase class C family)
MTRRTLLSSTAALPLARAQAPSLPSTPAGKVLEKWLAAMATGSRDAIAAYVKIHEPEADAGHIDMLAGLASDSGGFDLLAVEESQPAAITVLLRNRKSGEKLRFHMEVEDSEPPVVAGANLQPAEPGQPAPKPVRLSMDEAIRSVESFATVEAEADRFSGALLIAANGKIKFQKVWGLSDREAKSRNTMETKFRFGSMGKMFTAVAALQLVEKGQMALSDPVGKHLPDYPNKDLAAKVTVRHLLTHTGGTGDIFGPQYREKREQLRSLQDYVQLFGARPLQFEPGARWSYSNYGYLLLGVLVERVSGLSYEECLQERVFGPAGMRGTGLLPESVAVAQRANGYIRQDNMWVNCRDTLPWRGTPAGGGYATIGDLFRFALALQGGKLIGRSLVDEAVSKREKADRPGLGYGYGFMVDERAPKFFGHAGGAPGMNGELRIYPQQSVVVAALSNFDPPAASAVVRHFVDRMPVSVAGG